MVTRLTLYQLTLGTELHCTYKVELDGLGLFIPDNLFVVIAGGVSLSGISEME